MYIFATYEVRCQQQSESKQVIGEIEKGAWMKLHILKDEEEK